MNILGIDSLSNPLLLAKRKVSRSMMASSYDRRGGNHDWSNYLRREGRAAVMMDSEGPGCITRIWTADPQKGTVKIFIDRNPEPVIKMPFEQLFQTLPLTHGVGGEGEEHSKRSSEEHLAMGYTTYCPIPFQSHCKVTIEPEDDYLYYHINAQLYPPGTQVEPFELEPWLNATSIVNAKKQLSDWSDGKPLIDMSSAVACELNLQPGEEAVILDHEGAGIVRGIRLRLPEGLTGPEREHVRENLWLIAHFDEDEPRDASVRAPIGPMFLDYGQEPAPGSLFCGADSQGEYYCFFPMPHHLRAKIRLVNRSVLGLTVTAQVLHEPAHEIERDLLRFRATWHIETPFGPDHRDYDGLACRLLNLDGFNNVEFLYAFGAGHFVGCSFVMDVRDAPTDRALCEGDEMFFVDDDPRLTMYGTGAEDYLNDAWGVRGYAGYLSGTATMGEWGNGLQMCGYRLHVPDPIPFTRTGRFTIEHGTGNNCSGLFKSVAYWYMDPSLTRTRTEEWRWNDLRTGKRKINEEE